MKKILLATTVLALSAGVAAAEIALNGSARMGVRDTGAGAEFSSRVRFGLDGSGTTDGGLSFGASMRVDQSGQGNTANGDSTVFVSGAFGKLTMGDVAGGAADNLVGQVSGVGYTGLTDANEIGWVGGTATAARYDFTSGALEFSLGIGQPSSGDDAYSAAVKYSGATYSVALGYSSTAVTSQIDLLGSATFGAATVKARVADRDNAADTAFAVSLDYAMGPTTVTVFSGTNVDFAGTDTVGLGAAYDLGGGASFKGGIVDNGGPDAIYEAGVTLKF